MSEQESGQSESSSLEDKFLKVCAILEESVAAGFAPASEESLAIRDAAIAYHTVHFNKSMRHSYEKLRRACVGKITDEEWDEMKANLRRHGIDPDELEDDEPNNQTAADLS